ncbi:hypothetical protein [Mesoterricola silvestris]|uniref:PKD-like domain-containing protein n=1 Tax=Mesoterricola silvestris TaxID=2927979 RepID=A0AA48K8Y4_9BACT|nr:hypothetical protein [Mesoterricola silvestris]BDU71767.1 hypothetical protein METEAL_09410 [Mesoterricola silvestris]
MGAAVLDRPPHQGLVPRVLFPFAAALALAFMPSCSGGGGGGSTPAPAPTTPVVTAPAYVTSGATNLTASTPAQTNCTFTWTITNGTLTAGATSTSVTFTAGTSGAVTLSCVATNADKVASAAGTATSTIVAAPVLPVITTPANVSPNATGLTATVPAQTGCTYAWTIANGTITAGGTTASVTFTAGASGTTDLGCVVTNAAGTASAKGTASSTIITTTLVQPVVTAPTAATAGTAGLTASVPAQTGAIFAWTITGGTLTAGADTNTVTFTAGDVGSLQLSCVASNLAGATTAPGTATVAVLAAPTTPTITVASKVTAGATGLTASVPAQTGSTYAWTLTGGTITAGGTTNAITFTAGASGTVGLSCVVTNGAGTPSTAGTASSTIYAAPATPTITVASKVTAGATGLTASVPAQTGSTYAWTLTGGTVTAGAGTNAITFTAGASGTVGLSCVVTNGAGTPSAAGTASSTIYPAPVTPAITVVSKVTAGAAGLTATATAQAGSTYAWTLTGGTVTFGAGTDTITFTAGASGTVGLSCVVTNGAGLAGTAGTASSTIYPAPVTPSITVASKVTALTAGLTATATPQAGSSYAWILTGGTVTAGAGTDTITFTAGASGTVDLSCVVTNGAGLAGTAGTASSTIYPAPVTPSITVASKVTALTAGLTATATPQAGSTYAWILTGGTVTAGSGTDTITFTAGATGTVDLSCVVTNGAGLAGTAGTASSTIYAAPSTPSIVVANYVTASSTGNTASVTPQADSTYAWTITGGTFTAGETTASATFTANASGTVGLSCVVTNGAGSPSTPGTGSSTIVAAASTPTIGVASYVTTLSTGNVASITPQANSTYAWTITGGTFTAGQTTASATFTADASGTVHLTCTVSNQAGTAATPGAADSTIVPLATTPTITVASTVTDYVTQNKVGGYTASVPDQGNNSTYAWSITGGSFTAGQTTVAPTFTPSTVGTVTLTCTVSNAAGLAATAATKDITCVAAPAVTSFTPGAAIIGTNAATTLNAVFTGSSAKVNGGALADAAITSGTPLATGNLASTTSFTLTVSNQAGDTTPATVKVLVGSLNAYSGIPSGQGNTDGSYPDARFWEPNGMVFDGSGNIYVSDYDNNTIRMITSGGVVSTPYGTAGKHGNDDLVGTAATFFGPSGLAFDGTFLYVADTWNQTIRKINTTNGQVSTLAGTPGVPGNDATHFHFSQANVPVGLALDGTTLYVADHLNNAIRVVDKNTGAMTTLAVNGAAFNWVTGLAVDTVYRILYVTDKGSNSVIGLDLTGSPALATTLSSDFINPVGLALSADAATLYVTDYETSVVKSVDSFYGAVPGQTTIIAGALNAVGSTDNSTGTSARFQYPTALLLDAANLLYVADFANNTIRTVAFGGTRAVNTIQGVAGGAAHRNRSILAETALYNSPRGIAVDYTHNLAFVAETSGNYIRAIDLSTGLTGDVAQVPGASPNGIAVQVSGAGGTIYFTETATHLVKSVTYTGGDVTNPASFGTPVILAGISGTPGATDGTTGITSTFNGPTGIAVDATGNVYVADQGNHLIRRISSATDNPVSTIGGQLGVGSFVNGAAGISTFNNPTGLALSGNNLFVADQSNNAIRLISLDTNTASTFAGQATPGSADGTGTGASFLNPNALAVDGAGNVYVADTYNNTIRRITPAGEVTTIIGIPGTMKNILANATTPLAASLAFPVGIAVPADLGTMYIVVPDAVLKVAF